MIGITPPQPLKASCALLRRLRRLEGTSRRRPSLGAEAEEMQARSDRNHPFPASIGKLRTAQALAKARGDLKEEAKLEAEGKDAQDRDDEVRPPAACKSKLRTAQALAKE